MDPQLRDQLEENDLAVFLAGFGRWWGKHGGRAILIALVAAVVILGKRTLDLRASEQHERAWSELASATSPEVFRNLAASTDNPAVRALAYLRGGDLLLAEANKPGGGVDESDPSDDPESDGGMVEMTRDQLLAEADLMYAQVLEGTDAHAVVRLNAYLGLAAVAESRSDWEDAERHYKTVLAEAGPGQPATIATAQARMELIPRLAEPVHFAPAPAVSIDDLGGESADELLDLVSPLLTPQNGLEADPIGGMNLNLDVEAESPETPILPDGAGEANSPLPEDNGAS